MKFQKIDKAHWTRSEYFQHYFSDVPCTYSITVKLDVTPIKERSIKLYPAMLYHLTTIVNRHAEFRTAINEAGDLGVYSNMHPCYTVFHKDTETFSNLWTAYTPDLGQFCAAYEADLRKYGARHGMVRKPDIPPNTFPVSMLPWTVFDGFNLNLKNGYSYLLPIFTMGRTFPENGRTILPISIQVHHAVCDGFHVCRFVSELQAQIQGGDTSAASLPAHESAASSIQ